MNTFSQTSSWVVMVFLVAACWSFVAAIWSVTFMFLQPIRRTNKRQVVVSALSLLVCITGLIVGCNMQVPVQVDTDSYTLFLVSLVFVVCGTTFNGTALLAKITQLNYVSPEQRTNKQREEYRVLHERTLGWRESD